MAEGRAVLDEAAHHWTTAADLIEADRPRAALPHLERLVSLFPGDPRFRFALGRALFEIGKDERATFHLEQALAGPLPREAQARVETLLERIRTRKTWQAGFTFALVPETNAARRTQAEEISIGGIRFRLNPDARARSGTGLHFGGSGAYIPRIGRDLRLRLALAANARLFRESELNDLTLRGEVGLLRFGDAGTEWGGGLSLQRRWIGNDAFMYAPGIFASYATRPDSVTRLSVRGDVEQHVHDELAGLDGPRLRVSAAIARVVNPRLILRARAFGTRIGADAVHERGVEGGLTLGGSYAFSGGLMTGLDVTVARGRRDGASPLFGISRREDRFEASLSLLHRSVSWRGFAPTLEVTHDVRRANIELYDYETTRLSIGITRRF